MSAQSPAATAPAHPSLTCLLAPNASPHEPDMHPPQTKARAQPGSRS